MPKEVNNHMELLLHLLIVNIKARRSLELKKVLQAYCSRMMFSSIFD